MAARGDVSDRLDMLQQQIRQLDARSRRTQVSPLFTLAIGLLIGALIAMLVAPRSDKSSPTS